MAFLTENEQKWTSIIKEELGIQDANKLQWMSKLANIHAIHEGIQDGSIPVDGGIYATPLNTLGFGNPMAPQGLGMNHSGSGTGIGNTGADFHNPDYVKGSGDVPMSTLTMALEIAGMTIGFELVPVIPSPGPWTWLSYMDTPYAGGKLGRVNETAMDGKGEGAANKPIYIKFNTKIDAANLAILKANTPLTLDVTVKGDGANAATLLGKFIGLSRIDGSLVVKVESCKAGDDNASIAEVFGNTNVKVTVKNGATTVINAADVVGKADLVSGAADHVQGFANFFDGGADPMTRAQNETGVGNTIGARMFTKMVQMGSYEVTGTVTRQQLQDMPLYGVDVIGKVLERMQDDISQHINNRILDRVFKLGVTNAVNQLRYQGVNLNLYLAGAGAATTKNLSAFTGAHKFVGVDNAQHTDEFGAIKNAIQNTAAENVTTHQRRIMSRMLAAANLIHQVSRRGRGQWAVMSTKTLSALQDAANFVYAPMTNTLVQDGSQSLYFAGSVAGLNIYVDPYMNWDDNRICVGRKSNGAEPGVIFMPYILADTVQTIVEGTMAPKLLVNSRFAIVDAGFYPEQSYFTFMYETDGDLIL